MTASTVKEKIALQMISHVVEPGQLMYQTEQDEGGFYFEFGADPSEGGIPTFIETENPDSKFFSLMLSNAGMLHRRAYPKAEYVGFAKAIDTEEGRKYEYVNKYVHDAREGERTIKARGSVSQVVLSMDESDYTRFLQEDGSVYVPFTEASILKLWEPGYGTSSQTRKAEMVVKPVTQSYHDYFRQIGFSPSLFLKADKKRPGHVMVPSLDKMSKRVKQTASSSRPRAFMMDYHYLREEDVAFTVFADTKDEKTVMATRIVLAHNETGVEEYVLIADDFLVRQEVELVVPVFHRDPSKKIGVKKMKKVIDKAATDGSHLFDRDFAFDNGMADGKDLRAGEHFRWGAPIKGFAFLFPGLKSLSGYIAILFDGGIKGDARVAFRQFPMDFAVLTRGRRSEEFPRLKLSRQVLSAIQDPTLLDGLEADTKALIERVLSFDEEAIRLFLSIQEEVTADGDVFDAEQEVDVDQLTTRLYAVGRKTFLKSHTMKKKLADLLHAALRKFGYGSSLYLEDASFKHMLVDPWTIVQYMRAGFLSADKFLDEHIGIKPDHVLVSSLKRNTDGQLVHYVDTQTACLFRFPFLHRYEGRKVNVGGDNPFGDENAQAWYQYLAKSGQLQGLILYSLWDMHPEGQSGADFDGDQTLWTVNPHITENMDPQPYFLDYAYVEQEDGSWELVSGCPFPGDSRTLKPFLDEEQTAFMEANDVILEGDSLSFPEALVETPAIESLIGHLGAALARTTLVPNDIGTFTNINSTVFNIISVLEKHMMDVAEVAMSEGFDNELEDAFLSLQTERDGLEHLTLLLAVSIRWEIDKAKHGGAYREHMPFLEALDGFLGAGELLSLEDQYGVSLQRLLLGERQLA